MGIQNAPWLFYDFHHHLSSSLFVSCLYYYVYCTKTKHHSFLKATTFTTFHTRLFFIRQGIFYDLKIKEAFFNLPKTKPLKKYPLPKLRVFPTLIYFDIPK